MENRQFRNLSHNANNFANRAIHATDKAERILHQSGKKLHESLDHMKDKTEDLRDDVVSYVRHNPLKAMGIAMLAGALLSQFTHLMRK